MTVIVPYLTFRDGSRSLEFLSASLGFVIVTRQDDAVGRVVHAELARDGAVIMGGEGEAKPATVPGIYLVVADVDAVFAQVVAGGAQVVFPPEETEWGTRRARFLDLDGHEWTIGSYVPGRSW